MKGLSLVSGSNLRLLPQIIVTFFLEPMGSAFMDFTKDLSLTFGRVTGSDTETGR